MKNLLIVILILFTISLSAVTFDLSLSFRTPKADSVNVDYEISSRCSIDSLFSVEIEIERDDGEYYRNIELFGWQYWRFLQLSGKYVNIQEDDLEIAAVDLRVKYKTHSVGISEVWDLHPQTMIVVGEDVRWKFGIPYLCPVEFRSVINFYTANFYKYNNETEITFSGAISSIMSLYIRHKQRYYDQWNWSFKIGMSLKI